MGKQRDKRPVRKKGVKAENPLDFMYDSEPTFVNEQGVKWYLNKPLTRHAQKEDRRGIALKANIFRVEIPGGQTALVMVMGDKVVFKADNYETMGFEIDVMKLGLHFKDEKPGN